MLPVPADTAGRVAVAAPVVRGERTLSAPVVRQIHGRHAESFNAGIAALPTSVRLKRQPASSGMIVRAIGAAGPWPAPDATSDSKAAATRHVVDRAGVGIMCCSAQSFRFRDRAGAVLSGGREVAGVGLLVLLISRCGGRPGAHHGLIRRWRCGTSRELKAERRKACDPGGAGLLAPRAKGRLPATCCSSSLRSPSF